MQRAIIHVRGLSHRYRSRHEDLGVLDGVSFDLGASEYGSLIGPSGSGKTTLLSLIGGLEKPQSGELLVAGKDLSSLAGDELARYRTETVGFVFQHFGLLETLTAQENVELALTFGGGLSPQQRRRRAVDLLDRVHLGGRLGHRPPQLSGGERQRVAIARALANDPKLILADEPTGDLDEDTAADVGDLLEELRADRGCTLLVVTHQQGLAARADRKFALGSGRLVELHGALP